MKALREQGLLPRVIAGSSVGSIGEQLLAPSRYLKPIAKPLTFYVPHTEFVWALVLSGIVR